MIKTSHLRVGQHVLVGSKYETFSVPKHLAIITQIGKGYILCVSDPEQGDPDEYNEDEIDGILLETIVPLLEKNGFFKSKLSNERYIKQIEVSKDRIVINMSGVCTCNGTEFVDRSGVKYLHQLESCIIDAGIEFEFQI